MDALEANLIVAADFTLVFDVIGIKRLMRRTRQEDFDVEVVRVHNDDAKSVM